MQPDQAFMTATLTHEQLIQNSPTVAARSEVRIVPITNDLHSTIKPLELIESDVMLKNDGLDVRQEVGRRWLHEGLCDTDSEVAREVAERAQAKYLR